MGYLVLELSIYEPIGIQREVCSKYPRLFPPRFEMHSDWKRDVSCKFDVIYAISVLGRSGVGPPSCMRA